MHCGEPVRGGNSRSTGGTSSHPRTLPSAATRRAHRALARPPPPLAHRAAATAAAMPRVRPIARHAQRSSSNGPARGPANGAKFLAMVGPRLRRRRRSSRPIPRKPQHRLRPDLPRTRTQARGRPPVLGLAWTAEDGIRARLWLRGCEFLTTWKLALVCVLTNIRFQEKLLGTSSSCASREVGNGGGRRQRQGRWLGWSASLCAHWCTGGRPVWCYSGSACTPCWPTTEVWFQHHPPLLSVPQR